MNFWIISDTHFGHKNIEKYCNRQLNFEDKILASLEKDIKENDVLIHLGDFCFGKDTEWHQKFFEKTKCLKYWLVIGNHDKNTISWYLTHGWDFVGHEIILYMYGKIILFSHRANMEGRFDINIHGHYHNNSSQPIDDKYYLIKMEDEYCAINLKKIIEEKKPCLEQ